MRKTLLTISLVVAMSAWSAVSFAATLADDSVLSQHIKDADGTTGQNTSTGAGIKTGHIQNSAVTSSKIADGAVTTTKIATGAVTDAQVAAGISESKITNLQSDLAGKSPVTHNHDSLYQQKYGKVAVVAVTGGDYSDPVMAMNNLSTWCGTPSATNQCLLKIMPGVYTLGTGSILFMQPYVDLEGSGENATTIAGDECMYAAWYTGVVVGAPNSEIRSLSVENTDSTCGSSYIYAIWIGQFPFDASPSTLSKITHVTAKATNNVAAMGIGIGNFGGWGTASQGKAILTNVVSKGTSAGINVANGYVVLNNVIFDGSTGIYRQGINLINPTGYIRCLGVYDGDYNAVTCP